MENEVKGIFHYLESEDKEIENVRKLDDQSNRAKNQCPGVPGKANIKMYGIKIY